MKTETTLNHETPPIAKVLLAADWIPVSEKLPKKGLKVKCKLSCNIGFNTTEKILYRMKHSGEWNDYSKLVTHWKTICS